MKQKEISHHNLLIGRKVPFWIRFKKEAPFHIMIWLAVGSTLIFNYLPMSGLVIAFKNYRMRQGIWGSAWVGLKNFQNMFVDFYMGNAIINTFSIALLDTLIALPLTIMFAVLLNELSNKALKRTVQTISYLPHFISWVIMAVLLQNFLHPIDGLINNLLGFFGKEPILFLGRAELYWPTIIVASIWKNIGWNAIIYLAVMSGIDEELYEAARIDGAGRIARIRFITLPCLSGIISIMLILRMGAITNTGFEQAFYLSNELNFKRSNVLSYYLYDIGLRKGDFSYSTAIGLVTSTVSAILMLTSNWLAQRIRGTGLF